MHSKTQQQQDTTKEPHFLTYFYINEFETKYLQAFDSELEDNRYGIGIQHFKF